ncbi:hypothetical protein [Mucilaginibacter ginkgonis]|uniref:Uncharacterized protein n=1 Tax=Mucilaginibacter ginkgonis TaxID=2682091 RepID=A0A7T7FAH2_9SPHI|nr:hypothetical protein [Mucilaginibacter ginkgonis]QQL49603.1 hypothetical protein GO620_015735 [Mucilaginibacter ginkgonis]
MPHKAFALQNILRALITQALSGAKYLSPKLRADASNAEIVGTELTTPKNAASVCAAITGPENCKPIVAQGAAASFFGYFL